MRGLRVLSTSFSGPPSICDCWIICFVIGSWGSCHKHGDWGSRVYPASFFRKVFVSGVWRDGVVQGTNYLRRVLISWFLSAARHSIQWVSAHRLHGRPLLQAATSGVARRRRSLDGLS